MTYDPPVTVPFDDLTTAERHYPLCTNHPAKCFGCLTSPSFSPRYHTFLVAISNIQEPRTYCQAVSIPEWRDPMTIELTALHRTGIWELVPLPPGKTLICCKSIYKVKTNSDGSIDRYKTRLVARGFSQEYGIEYEEMFVPIAKMISVHVLIAIAASRS
ncbi:uncharacterized protein LOC109715384 [Ananas comosus]|uniref:Uncharacterized protein LOC109715384 n=1 Tax=Ananas comosus TaxID=4615 RepID=A0A6P5FSB0_ANACO|nr:uncharacterized protein LOC109715384 [Ananas comosus]